MTDDAELPADLRAFLYSCIDSVDQVQILMRLHATEGAFTARTLARELGAPDPSVTRRHLEILVARGLLQTAVGDEVFYRYAPRSAELQRFADMLSDWWRAGRTSVLRYVVNHERRPLKSFSDAFDLRGD